MGNFCSLDLVDWSMASASGPDSRSVFPWMRNQNDVKNKSHLNRRKWISFKVPYLRWKVRRVGKHSSAIWILCSTQCIAERRRWVNKPGKVWYLRLRDQAINDCPQRKIGFAEILLMYTLPVCYYKFTPAMSETLNNAYLSKSFFEISTPK